MDCLWAKFQNSCDQDRKVTAMLNWSDRILGNVLVSEYECKLKLFRSDKWRVQVCQDKDFAVGLPSSNDK